MPIAKEIVYINKAANDPIAPLFPPGISGAEKCGPAENNPGTGQNNRTSAFLHTLRFDVPTELALNIEILTNLNIFISPTSFSLLKKLSQVLIQFLHTD